MDKDSVRKIAKYCMKHYPYMMIGMSMTAEQIRTYNLTELAYLSAMYENSEKVLKKYRIKLELKKPYLQKTYELFGKAV